MQEQTCRGSFRGAVILRGRQIPLLKARAQSSLHLDSGQASLVSHIRLEDGISEWLNIRVIGDCLLSYCILRFNRECVCEWIGWPKTWPDTCERKCRKYNVTRFTVLTSCRAPFLSEGDSKGSIGRGWSFQNCFIATGVYP